MIGALVLGVAGAGLSAWGASKSAKQAAGAYDSAAEQQQAVADQQFMGNQHAIGKAEAAIGLAQDRMVNAERTRAGVMYGLGMPGSYEDSYEDFIAGLGGQSPFMPSGLNPKKQARYMKREGKQGPTVGLFRKTSETVKTPGAGPVNQHGEATALESEVTDYKLNPKKAQEKIAASRSGRMVSYMTAQADQLLRQEGPLWEQIKESVHGPIIEGAGQQHQQLLQRIQTEAAKGGSARNRAIQVATELAASQDIARGKQEQLWGANLQLIKFGIDNAKSQLSFNDSWINNRAGIRDQFNNMMNSMTELRVNTVMGAEIGAANGYASSQMAANAATLKSGLVRADGTKNMYGLIGGGLMSIAGGLMGGGASGGAGVAGGAAAGLKSELSSLASGIGGLFGGGSGGGAAPGGGYTGSQMTPNNLSIMMPTTR